MCKRLLGKITVREDEERDRGGWEAISLSATLTLRRRGRERKVLDCSAVRRQSDEIDGVLKPKPEVDCTSQERACLSIFAVLTHWLGAAKASVTLVQRQPRIQSTTAKLSVHPAYYSRTSERHIVSSDTEKFACIFKQVQLNIM